MKLVVLIVLVLSTLAGMKSAVSAMDVTVEELQLGPLGQSAWIGLSGEIEEGDSDKVKKALTSIDYSVATSVNFEFNSPGGSVVEAMKIGRIINDLPHGVSTTIGAKGLGTKGICASACVLAFMGGHYRFSSGGKIGVHQFFFSNSISGDEASSLSQELSADIVSYMREMRVDSQFLSVMAKVKSTDIFWVPDDILREHRVVNQHIFDESEEYKNADGLFYLLMWQQSRYGENKIVIGCDSTGSLIMVAFLQPPEVYLNGSFKIRIDGKNFSPKSWEIIRERRWVEVGFVPTQSQVELIKKSNSFGARMVVPSGDFFFGFEKTVQSSKLKDTLNGCPNNNVTDEPLSSLSGSGMSDIVGVDLLGGDLLKNGVRNVNFSECKQICLSIPKCDGVTWVISKKWCWPKGAGSKWKKKHGLISAIRQ